MQLEPGAGTDEPAPDIVSPHEGGTGLVIPTVETRATGAAVDEPVADVVVPQEVVSASGILPSVEPDAPGAGAHDSSELEVDGLPSAETDAPAAGTDEPAPHIAHPPKGGCGSGELPCVLETAAPGAGGETLSECDLEGYGSLGEDDVDIISDSQPQSPTRDLNIAKEVNISRAVFEQLKIKWGGAQTQVLEAIVIPNDQPACFIVSCMLYDKLLHWKWRIVESHQHGESTYVYAKMRHTDLVRFHAKLYGWGEARATFCSVHTVLPVTPEPMDAHLAVQLS